MILTPAQVRKIRAATGLSQRRFADTFGFTVKAVNAMERDTDGEHRLRPPNDTENEYLLRIAHAWHVDLTETGVPSRRRDV